MTGEYVLQPAYDGRKSFYGKAVVVRSRRGDVLLRSYDRPVAWIDRPLGEPRPLGAPRDAGGGEQCPDGRRRLHRLWDDWSRTTARHVDELCRQAGLRAVPKAEWLALPVEPQPQWYFDFESSRTRPSASGE